MPPAGETAVQRSACIHKLISRFIRLIVFPDSTLSLGTPSMAYENLMVFTGNANPALAEGVAKNLGIRFGKAVVSMFWDGEVMVEIIVNVRGKDVFVLL
jgi:hypothetical protein